MVLALAQQNSMLLEQMMKQYQNGFTLFYASLISSKKQWGHFTGAVGQQRLPKDYLADVDIPLPLLPEQKRIASILNENLAAVEKARKAAEEQLEAINVLPSSLLKKAMSGEL